MKQDLYQDELYEIPAPNAEDVIEQPPVVKKKDPVLAFLAAQLVVCCLALAAAVVVQLVGGDIYRNVRDKYIELFCDPTSVSEVLETLSSRLSFKDDKSPAVTDTTVQAMAVVTATDKATEQLAAKGDGYGDSADDSMAMPKNKILLKSVANTGNTATNNMALPVVGTVTSDFGYRIHPIYGTRLFHNGVDIGADTGSNIMAALSGKVETAAYNDSYGYHVILDHGNEFRTVYAHCSKLLVEKGQQIEKGSVIALVGSTGVATGPHLHFEVRRGEFKVNPAWLVDLS